MRTTVVGKTRTENPHFIIYYEPEQVLLKPQESPVEVKVCVSSCPLCARPVAMDPWYTISCEACRTRIEIATT